MTEQRSTSFGVITDSDWYAGQKSDRGGLECILKEHGQIELSSLPYSKLVPDGS